MSDADGGVIISSLQKFGPGKPERGGRASKRPNDSRVQRFRENAKGADAENIKQQRKRTSPEKISLTNPKNKSRVGRGKGKHQGNLSSK